MARVLKTGSLFILLAVVAVRPLVSETYDAASRPFTAALGEVTDPSPVTTLVFDLLILLAAAGWLLGRASGRGPSYRRTGLEWGAALVLVAAIVSCVFAGNKRIAISGAIDWLCLPVLAIVLTQLLVRPWHRRLVMAVVLSSACANVLQCVDQYYFTFDDTWSQYESNKADFWARQGVDVDSPRVEQFERRILSRESTGFLPHSNVAGSYLVLCGLAVLGLAIGTLRSRDRRMGGVALAVAAGAVLYAASLTNSLGALVSGAGGLCFWLIAHLLRARIDANRRRATVVGWCCVLAGLVAVVGHGWYHGTLPSISLTFRWQWWSASSELVADHAWTGVGRENFGRHYLKYKPIESPEEVANPHNLFVQAASDWGLLGLFGMCVMLVGCSLVVTRRRGDDGNVDDDDEGPAFFTWAAWAIGLTAVLTVGRIPLIGSSDASFVYYTIVSTTVVWLIGFAMIAGTSSTTRDGERLVDRLMATGIAIGLLTFLVHDLINFALFVPASATTFFALLGCRLSYTAERAETLSPQAGRRNRWPAVGVAAATAIAAALLFGLLPVSRMRYDLSVAKAYAGIFPFRGSSAYMAMENFNAAAGADALDPAPLVEHARWLARLSTAPGGSSDQLVQATDLLDRAIDRDPNSTKLRRMRMQLNQRLAKKTGKAIYYRNAVDAAKEVLELYPLNPYGLAALAERQVEMGTALNDDALRSEAATVFQRALDMDGRRLKWETLRSFSEKERAKIQQQIDLLQARPSP